MEVINMYASEQNFKNLREYLGRHGRHLSENDLRDIKKNIIERTTNDNFQKQIDASVLPKLVDSLLKLKGIEYLVTNAHNLSLERLQDINKIIENEYSQKQIDATILPKLIDFLIGLKNIEFYR